MIDTSEQCYIRGRMVGLQVHHCLHGSMRKNCDEDGLTVYLCFNCHTKLHDKGIHDRDLQRTAQHVYEARIGDRESFIKRYGKSFF